MLVNVLVSVGQFQRDLQNELTREGLAAVRANGVRSGRRPRIAQLGALDNVRQEFRDGARIAALARDHHVSRAAIRTAVADLLPGRAEHSDHDTDSAGPRAEDCTEEWAPLRIEMPGMLADRLQHLDKLGALADPEQRALHAARTVRRGQGYSLHITAASPIHRALLRALADLDGQAAGPAQRKAYRIYRDRVRVRAPDVETPHQRRGPRPSARRTRH